MSLTTIAVIAFAAMGYYEPHERIETITLIFELVPEFFIALFTLRLLPQQRRDTPAKIVKCMGYYVIATIAVYLLLDYLFDSGEISHQPVTFWTAIVYSGIWTLYLMKSKRVRGFYGANAKY